MTEKEFLDAFEKSTGTRPVSSKIEMHLNPGKYVYHVDISQLKEFSKLTIEEFKIEGFTFNFQVGKMAFYTNNSITKI